MQLWFHFRIFLLHVILYLYYLQHIGPSVLSHLAVSQLVHLAEVFSLGVACQLRVICCLNFYSLGFC